MQYYHEISLPPVPPELVPAVDFDDPSAISVVIDSQPVDYGHRYLDQQGSPWAVCRYRFGKIVDEPLLAWLRTQLPQTAGLRFMALESSRGIFPPHIDGRPWALNYIIDTGGSAVRTQWYRQHDHSVIRDGKQPGYQINRDCDHIWWHNMDLLAEVAVPPARWYLIRTTVLHGVTEISGCRKGISISASEDWVQSLLGITEA